MSLNLRLLREENHLPSNHYSCHNFVVLRRANSFKMFWIRKPSFAPHGIDHRVRFTVYLLATPLTIHFSIIIVKVSASLTICTVSYTKKKHGFDDSLSWKSFTPPISDDPMNFACVPGHAMPSHIIPSNVIPNHTTRNHTIPYHTTPCHAMP